MVDPHSELVGDLLAGVGRFRRHLRRAGWAFPGVSESQAELLRLVGRRPGISVREAAGELGLAANTASTLVSKLVASGLLVRSRDPDDGRVGRLELSGSAQQVADSSRAARRAAVGEALRHLDETAVTRLVAGLEVLRELTHTLDRQQS